jgi:hypothetical protein
VCAFFITKVGSVRFLGLQKYVVSAFDITKFCSVRFLRLEKFVVSAFSLQKYVVHFSDMLYYP